MELKIKLFVNIEEVENELDVKFEVRDVGIEDSKVKLFIRFVIKDEMKNFVFKENFVVLNYSFVFNDKLLVCCS